MKRSEAPLDQPEAMKVDCPKCEGDGCISFSEAEWDVFKQCPRCEGRGWIPRSELEEADGK